MRAELAPKILCRKVTAKEFLICRDDAFGLTAVCLDELDPEMP